MKYREKLTHITRFCYKTKWRAIKMSDSDFVQ